MTRVVAAEIGLHESTIGRLVRAGSAATPGGTVPLQVFFARPVRRGAENTGRLGAPAIGSKIAALIATEAPANPLSDRQIADALASEGFSVSRRVVARLRTKEKIANRTIRRYQARSCE